MARSGRGGVGGAPFAGGRDEGRRVVARPDRLSGGASPRPAGLRGATTGGAVDRGQPGGEVQRPERLGAVQTPGDGVDGGGGGVVGRAGGGASQRGDADLEERSTSPRLEDPERSQES